jgi:hypothetical protein
MQKLYLILFLFILFSCKNTKEVTPSASLKLTVYIDSTVAATGASVSIFPDQASYESALASFNASGAIATKNTASDGSVIFTGLGAHNYWFYVIYEQNGKAYNNQNSMYTIKNPLNPGSLTSAVIDLQQSTFKFYFEAPTGSSNYPLKVTLSTDTFTIKNAISNNTPLYINKNPGIYNYSVKGSHGCVWTGIVSTVNQANSIPINLSPCYTGQVSFWSNSLNSKYLPITVILNNADTVGIITASRTTAPSCTDIINTASIYREYNSYTYTAISDSCVWTGTFKINASDTCQQIQLIPSCQ